MSSPQKYLPGVLSNPYKFCIRLVSDNFCDTSTFQAIKDAQRGFNIFQWKNNLTGANDKHQSYSGYTPWLHYSRGKWTKYDKLPNPDALRGPPMLKAHLFFKTMEEFKSWVGEEEFKSLLSDLV